MTNILIALISIIISYVIIIFIIKYILQKYMIKKAIDYIYDCNPFNLFEEEYCLTHSEIIELLHILKGLHKN